MLPDRLSRLLILISAGVSFASPGQALTLNEALAIRLATPNDITRSSVADSVCDGCAGWQLGGAFARHDY